MSMVPTNPVRLNLFGRWLAGVRANLGYTQIELSRRLNLHDANIGEWERGLSLPRAGSLSQATRLLSVNPMQTVSRHFATQLANEPYAATLLRHEVQLQILALGETSVNVVPSSNAFGNALKVFRERRGLTIETVAQDLAISWFYLKQLESGFEYPSLKLLQSLVAYYQREPQELIVLLIASRMVKKYRDFGVDFAAVCRQASREAKTRVITIQQCNAFGEALQTWRGERGIDRKIAANDLSIGESHLSNLETGITTEVKAELLEQIARYYNKDITDLLSLLLSTKAVKKHENISIDFPLLFAKAAEAARNSVTRVKQCNVLAETLRTWREESGYTQGQAADALGLSRSTISGLEDGKLLLSPETLSVVSEHYGKDLSETACLHFLSQTVQQYGGYSFDLIQLIQQAAENAEQDAFNPLGKQLKSWRLESGLTQNDAARNARLSRFSIMKWENGEVVPGLDSLNNLVDAYGKNFLEALPNLFFAQAMQQYRTLPVNIPFVLRQAAARARSDIIEAWECNALGDRLKKWREDLGKTVTQAADGIGIGSNELSMFEQGRSFPSFNRLRSLADYYQGDFNEAFPLLLLTQTVKDYPALPVDFERLFLKAAHIASTSIARVETSYASGDAMCGWRHEQGLTQLDIPIETGILKETFSKWELSKVSPEHEPFVRLVRYFGKDLTGAVSMLLLTEIVQEYGALALDFSEIFEEAAQRVESTVVQVQTTNAVGDLLARWRQERGHRSKDVSDVLEMGLSTVYNAESGNELPPFNTLMKLIQHYEKPLEEILPSYVISSAIRQYAFMNLNMTQLLRRTLAVLPQGLHLGFDGSPLSDLLNGKSNFLGDKLRELIQKSGVSLQDQAGLQNLARECGIKPDTFIGFIQGDSSLGEFLRYNEGNAVDPIEALSARLTGRNSHLIGLLGIDIGCIHEFQNNREPKYVSHQDGGPGFDLDSFDPSSCNWRKIEIKASLGVEPLVLFTIPEWSAAERYGDHYYLEVILNSSTSWPTLISIQDPFRHFEPQEAMGMPHVRFRDIRTLLEENGHSLDPIPPGVIEVALR